MKLVRLAVTNWRGISQYDVDFDDKITVVGGPNESGKSSLRAALRAALLRPSNARGEKKLLERERPWDTKLYPTVELEFSVNGELCSVRKEFLRAKNWADLKRNGRLIAQDDQVQTELMRLLGESADWIDVLWGEQGKLIYEKAPESIKGKLAQAAQATVLPQVAELERLIEKEYLEFWTAKSEKPNKKWKDIREKVMAAEEALSAAESRLAAANALSENLKIAEQQIEASRAQYAKLEAEWKAGQEQLGAWESYNAAVATLDKQKAELSVWNNWKTSLQDFVDKLRLLIPASAAWQEQVLLLDQKLANKPDRSEPDEMRRKLHFINLLIAKRRYDELENIKVPSSDELSYAVDVDNELREIEMALRLGAINAQITAERALNITLESDGAQARHIALSENETEKWQTNKSFELNLPGVARISVQSGDASADANLQKRDALKAELQSFLSKWEAATVDEISVQCRKKAESLRHFKHVDDSAFSSARAAVPDAADIEVMDQAELAMLLDGLPAAIAIEDQNWSQADYDYSQDLAAYKQLMATNPVVECATIWDSLRKHVGAAPIGDEPVPALGEKPTEPVLTLISNCAAVWQSEMDDKAKDIAKLENELRRPDGEEVSKEKLAALRTLADASRNEVEALSATLNQAIGQIKEQDNLYEDVVRFREELAKAEAEQEQVDKHAFAIGEVQRAFDEARAKLQRDVVAPLQHLVGQRFGSITSGFYNAVAFDSSLSFNAVHAANLSEGVPVDEISFGTREQLALLTRLCLAELLAEAGERQVVILDDNLVHTDAARMALACRMMEDVADKVQIVVFTCHPERYSEFSAKQVFLRR